MNIVFDLGQVLIRWDPLLPLIAAGRSAAEAAEALEAMDFPAWNAALDAGRSSSEALAALDPAHVPLARTYLEGFAHSIPERIEATWALLPRLRGRGHRLFAITNWSAETFLVAERLYPDLSIFEDIVVSGRERVVKPDPRIHELLCMRNGLYPDECLFIDDAPRNVAGAMAAGWSDALLFTTPEALAADLSARGLL